MMKLLFGVAIAMIVISPALAGGLGGSGPRSRCRLRQMQGVPKLAIPRFF